MKEGESLTMATIPQSEHIYIGQLDGNRESEKLVLSFQRTRKENKGMEERKKKPRTTST